MHRTAHRGPSDRLLLATAGLLAITLATGCMEPGAAKTHELPNNQPPRGFLALFNGDDLSGWWGLRTENPAVWKAQSAKKLEAMVEASRSDVEAHWRVENGELVNDGQGKFLTTEREFSDFELLVDYKTVAGADSGIYLRGIPQVQIWDYTEAGGKWHIGADKGSGGLWNNAPGAHGKNPSALADKPFGEWNHFRIQMVGERVSVELNGTLVVDHARLANYFDRKGNLPKSGPIQLQTHGGEIRWRNVFIREIDADEANAILTRAGTGQTGDSRSLFNGQDLEGWLGATSQYTVTDAETLCCKKHKGGTIYTEEQFDDFVVGLQIRLPPGGNNGLAIRYPGRGDPAYSGMCELQVLDDGHRKYKRLKPQQYHASIYGQVAARRGYLRTTGEWNFQRVTVRGPRIAVELNGYTILDADIVKDANCMYPVKRFKGRNRRRGHFGFAGHGDPVEFRAIRIRRLR